MIERHKLSLSGYSSELKKYVLLVVTKINVQRHALLFVRRLVSAKMLVLLPKQCGSFFVFSPVKQNQWKSFDIETGLQAGWLKTYALCIGDNVILLAWYGLMAVVSLHRLGRLNTLIFHLPPFCLWKKQIMLHVTLIHPLWSAPAGLTGPNLGDTANIGNTSPAPILFHTGLTVAPAYGWLGLNNPNDW